MEILKTPNPFGVCGCGCGKETPLAPQSDTKRRWIKGKPIRFIHLHQNKIICHFPRSEEAKKNIANGKLREKNPNWRGIDVGYGALHEWVINRLKRPLVCSRCNQSKIVELSNISGEYKRDLNDWEWLCRKCHMQIDGRLENFYYMVKRSKKIVMKEFENQMKVIKGVEK